MPVNSTRPAPTPPRIHHRREIPWRIEVPQEPRMQSSYNNERARSVLFASQREDVPVILHVVDPHRPVAGSHALLVLQHALTVAAVDGDIEIDVLVGAIAQQDRRRALRELQRLGLLLAERERAA